jgi:Trk K+ transport system NAD-binding subunit
MKNIDGTEFVELTLLEESPVLGKTVQELSDNLPNDCILISIRRNGKVLIPHGNTSLKKGDHLTAFIHSGDAEKFYKYFNSESTE